MELEKDSTPPRAAAHRPPVPRKADDEVLAEEIVRVVTAVAEVTGQRVALPADGPRGHRGVSGRGCPAAHRGMVNAMIEALERKASVERPSASSSHKLEMLASISHELVLAMRPPLARAKALSEDPEQTLNEKQIEHANTICSSGGDVLALVNEIVDLSRVDAENIAVAPRDVRLSEIIDFVDRSFRPLAERKQLTYTTEVRVGLPGRIYTDPQRLQQVLGDLLANASRSPSTAPSRCESTGPVRGPVFRTWRSSSTARCSRSRCSTRGSASRSSVTRGRSRASSGARYAPRATPTAEAPSRSTCPSATTPRRRSPPARRRARRPRDRSRPRRPAGRCW